MTVSSEHHYPPTHSGRLDQARKRLGFSTQSGFVTFLSLALPFLAFLAIQSPHLHVQKGLCGPHRSTLRAGQCSYYAHPTVHRHANALSIHLAAIFPAALLAITQFIPRIRQQYPRFHRWAGRASLSLCVPGILSVPSLLDRAFGGGFDSRISSALLCGLTLWAVQQAWATARRRDFKDHRKWATRAWVWLACIVTHRAIIAPFAVYATMARPRPMASIPCPQIWGMLGDAYGPQDKQNVWMQKYAGMCSVNTGLVQGWGFVMGNKTTSQVVVSNEGYGLVPPDFLNGAPEEEAAAIYLAFAPAFWVAILLHVAGTELWFKYKEGGMKALAGTDSLAERKNGPVTVANGKGAKTL